MVEVTAGVLLSPGEVARRSGIAVSTLHFYEREGLIVASRTAGNQRRYRRDVLRRIAFIRFSQQVGIPLSRIRYALDTLPRDRTAGKEDWRRLIGSWHDDLDERIRVLQALRGSFTDCIGCGCLSLRACSMLNHDDQLAAEGAGARRIIDRADPS
jgi:MerR family redox-sensitive transcriptional activator SoxR